MKAIPPVETEIKLPVASAEEGRRRLRQAGFRVHRRRVFEDNIVLDTPANRLRESGTLLRLRRVGKEVLLTYKGRVSAGRHKSREEWEVAVGNWEIMNAIAERLGFTPAFRYQKYRTEYAQPRGGGVATLDETPVGIFLEVEGSPAWIDRAARRLGFQENDYILDSYGSLYQTWCEEHAVKPSHMVFASRDR